MSRPRFFLLFPTLLTSLFGSCQRYEDLSADAFLSRLGTEPDAQLVDVRTPEEFAAGHLPGARNIDCLAARASAARTPPSASPPRASAS